MRTTLAPLALCMLACSGPRSVTPTEYCHEMLAIACTTHHCCSMPSIAPVDCPADSTLLFDARCRQLFGDLRNPHVQWDGVAAADALDRLRTQAEHCALPGATDVPDAFITGTGRIDDDCTSGLGTLTRATACAQGTCDPSAGRCVVLGHEGAPCLADDQRCIADLYCPMPADVCVARTAIGGPCDSQHPATCITRRCAADSGVAPADGGVDSGLPVNGSCQPPIPDGQPCGEYDTCAGRCLHGTCATLSSSDTYFCAPPPPIPGYFG